MINEAQARLMAAETNTMMLAGIRKDSAKLQREIDAMRNGVEKENAVRQREEEDGKLIVEEYKAKVCVPRSLLAC